MATQIRQEIQKLSKIQLRQEDFIGQGGYALVYRYRINNATIALKCFQNQEEASQEMQILGGIQSLISNCPGILEFYGMKKIQIEILGVTSEQYVIFLQACNIDLQKMMLMTQKFQTSQVFDLWSQLSLSLLCIHMNNCFHGDIKPANILLNTNNQQWACYFTDFGQGKIVGSYVSTNFETLSLRGTLFYLAPELWKIYNNRETSGNYDPLSVDVYSLGMTIIELLVPKQSIQKFIAARGNEQQYQKEITNIKQELAKLMEFKNNLNDQLLNTLVRMVSFDPVQRPTTIEICQALVLSKQFSMNALTMSNMQALIIQLLSSLYWQKKQKNKLSEELQSQNAIIQELKSQLEGQKFSSEIIIPKTIIETSSFNSEIIKNLKHKQIILALFEKKNISLQKIHQQLSISTFDYNQFHQDCDGKGPTLIIMHSNEEPNSFFGGMAASPWNSANQMIADPVDKCSWLFKIELQDQRVNFHQWKCIDRKNAMNGNTYGPQFGHGQKAYLGAGYIGGYIIYGANIANSKLPVNNNCYQKVDLTENLSLGLLFELKKTIKIDCPSKVFGKIMNENHNSGKLNDLEVFSIKK